MNQKIKPIKRSEALIHLSKDHHFALLLTWKIREGIRLQVEPERISNYAIHFFDHDLKKHFAEEEKFLFPLLPEDHALRKKAMEDHEQIRTQIEKMRSDRKNSEVLRKFGETLESHIRFEERELFGLMQKEFSEEQLKNVSKNFGEPSEDTDSMWPDPFWKKS